MYSSGSLLEVSNSYIFAEYIYGNDLTVNYGIFLALSSRFPFSWFSVFPFPVFPPFFPFPVSLFLLSFLLLFSLKFYMTIFFCLQGAVQADSITLYGNATIIGATCTGRNWLFSSTTLFGSSVSLNSFSVETLYADGE